MTAHSMTETDVIELVRDQIIGILPDLERSSLGPDFNLKDWGIDSLGRMDIISGSVDAMGIDVPLHRFAQAETLADLAALLTEAQQ
jgi:polyketide biosynthesis acyl carrier protein